MNNMLWRDARHAVRSLRFLDWRDQQDVFTGLTAVGYAEISLKRDGNTLPEKLRAQRASAASLTMIAGIAIGLVGALGLSGLVRGFLFEVPPHDPWVYSAALLVLATTGLAAAFGPARRASSVDPLIALRIE